MTSRTRLTNPSWIEYVYNVYCGCTGKASWLYLSILSILTPAHKNCVSVISSVLSRICRFSHFSALCCHLRQKYGGPWFREYLQLLRHSLARETHSLIYQNEMGLDLHPFKSSLTNQKSWSKIGPAVCDVLFLWLVVYFSNCRSRWSLFCVYVGTAPWNGCRSIQSHSEVGICIDENPTQIDQIL